MCFITEICEFQRAVYHLFENATQIATSCGSETIKFSSLLGSAQTINKTLPTLCMNQTCYSLLVTSDQSFELFGMDTQTAWVAMSHFAFNDNHRGATAMAYTSGFCAILSYNDMAEILRLLGSK